MSEKQRNETENELLNEDQIIARWCADLYDQHLFETDEDVRFLLSMLETPSLRILEACCGSGRILVPLAKAGHDAVGFDRDPFMLERLAGKAKDLKNIAWRQADAIAEGWGEGYDVVVLAGNILFNIVADVAYEQAQALFIEQAANAVKPGGHVYIDYGCFARPEAVFGQPGARLIWEGTDRAGNTGRMVLLDSAYDAAEGIDRSTRRFDIALSNGEALMKDVPSIKHYASLEQLHGWLERAGLTVIREFGDYRRNPIGEHTHRAIIWARKR
ncbi:class I SAM-dependent methyltransferase [Paenibacillus lycopersici]|uniref:Class I SAM-dependent methyltransferase n=1 Tax=Paenibacillus lycopersici TaxID=2704462 RepID=A0A6C0FXN8_9BACL|nr:class I SAM-dependent methyltransferase [Paenibacillus lycopersici]QHT60044.1 class I SAM-dependent methyltransferase [Paenibacillus lycopersici]